MIVDFALFEAVGGVQGDFPCCGAEPPSWALASQTGMVHTRHDVCSRQVNHPGDHVAAHVDGSELARWQRGSTIEAEHV